MEGGKRGRGGDRRRRHAGSGARWGSLASAGALGLGLALAGSQLAGLTPLAQDAYVYHRVAASGELYTVTWASGGGPYQYSPAFAHALMPLGSLPLRLFTALWQLGLVTVLVATVGGWALPLVGLGYLTTWPVISLVASDIAMGNIQVLLGAVAVFGLRWPGLWAFALLSKVTPGIGLVWFLARGEWRRLAIALGVSAGCAGASFLLLPGDWFAWAAYLTEDDPGAYPLWTVPVPLWGRLATGAALVWWGGRTNRPWVVPLAVGWCIPLAYPTMVATMAAVFRYVSRPPARSPRLQAGSDGPRHLPKGARAGAGAAAPGAAGTHPAQERGGAGTAVRGG